MKTAEWQPIIPGLFLVPGANRGRFPHSHSFFVDGETTALIDVGCGPAVLEALLRVQRLDLAIISHSHVDHCGGLWRLPGTPVISPEQHADKFWRLEPLADRFFGPGPLADAWIQAVKMMVDARDAPAGSHYGDGHIFDFGRVRLQAIHAPGHLDDHYIFFEPRHGLVLLFDIDLTSFGPWYGNPESDIDLFLASIEKARALRPALVASSHKGIVRDDIDQHLRRFAQVFDRRDERLRELLRTARTIDELVDAGPIYGRETLGNPIVRLSERRMIEKHLLRLERRGQVRRDGDCRYSRSGPAD